MGTCHFLFSFLFFFDGCFFVHVSPILSGLPLASLSCAYGSNDSTVVNSRAQGGEAARASMLADRVTKMMLQTDELRFSEIFSLHIRPLENRFPSVTVSFPRCPTAEY